MFRVFAEQNFVQITQNDSRLLYKTIACKSIFLSLNRYKNIGKPLSGHLFSRKKTIFGNFFDSKICGFIGSLTAQSNRIVHEIHAKYILIWFCDWLYRHNIGDYNIIIYYERSVTRIRITSLTGIPSLFLSLQDIVVGGEVGLASGQSARHALHSMCAM